MMFKPCFRYKGMPISMLGLPDFGLYKTQSFRNSFSELKKKGYLTISENKAIISKAGKRYIQKKFNSMKQFSPSFPKDAPKNLIVMYDIPQERKAEREWFRFHLKKFGYKIIQKSVWVGPSPLPKEFVNYIKKIYLNDAVKVLKLAKPYQPDFFKF